VSRFVLDGSTALAWCFEDEQDADAMKVRSGLDGGEAVVPPIWPLEVLNGFLMAERRRRIGPADTNRFLALLAELPITVVSSDDIGRWPELAARARHKRLTAYDGAYLDLALQLGLPLASSDEDLRAAAAAAGVKLYRGGA
jgi:predicted nucleic acid-binding protein